MQFNAAGKLKPKGPQRRTWMGRQLRTLAQTQLGNGSAVEQAPNLDGAEAVHLGTHTVQPRLRTLHKNGTSKLGVRDVHDHSLQAYHRQPSL